MRTSRVFCDADFAEGDNVDFDKSQGHYLKNVLRLKSGAAFFLFNGRDVVDYEATLLLDAKTVHARVGRAVAATTESPLTTHILQGLGRADHVDWTIQKATELGVNQLVLFNSMRTQSPLKPAQLEKKQAHWRRVAISACEQCGRSILPEIHFYSSLQQALEANRTEYGILLNFEGQPLVQLLQTPRDSVSILLGPEGGLTATEIELAGDHGFLSARLGSRVLRTETAATAALAILQSTLGDLD